MPRTYEVRTYGCQMNVHDSERLTGLLEDAGYVAAPADDQADVVVFNTCAVRENADNKLYGNLGHLAPVKAAEARACRSPSAAAWPRRTAARSPRRRRGSTSCSAPTTSARCRRCSSGPGSTRRRRSRSSSRSRSSRRRCRPSASRRTPPGSRSPSAATTPARSASSRRCAARRRTAAPATSSPRSEALVAEGVIEVTLLGQNVNAYGVEFGDRQAFAKLLRACGEIEGLERVRFTSPHPAEFTDDVIAAMAETPNVMPQLHMPLQSGSDTVLKAMRRSYRQEKYLGIIDRVRAAMPDAAITTDIIVGFPGETEEDFRADARRRRARPGSPAPSRSSTPSAPARRPPRCRPDPARRRAGPLRAAGRAGQRDRLGREQAAGRPPRRGDGRRGRGPQGRRDPPALGPRPGQPAGALRPRPWAPSDVRPGDMVTVEITYAAPHHLVADGAVLAVRRTRSGDAWEARTAAPSAPVRRPRDAGGRRARTRWLRRAEGPSRNLRGSRDRR